MNNNKIKKVTSIFLVFMLIFALVGCNNKKEIKVEENKSVTTYPLTIKDSLKREVVIDKEPKRVISIAPNITETVAAVGKVDTLVGKTKYCDYPKEVSKVESIGTLTDPNIEKIVELKPDLVIASTHFKEAVLKKLEALNIKVVVLYGEESFDGVYETITNVGKVLNANSEAQKIVSDMKDKVKNVTDKVKDKENKKVYYVVSYGKNGDFTAGGDTFIGQMINLAGGDNTAKDLKGWKYSLEKLVANEPDILVTSKISGDKEKIKDENGYKDLKAVKDGKIYEIDNNLLDRQGPRLAQGLEELAKIVHPEAFK